MTASISVGQIVGLLLGGYMGPSFGWRFPFILASVPNLIILIFFIFLAKEPPRGSAEDSLQEYISEGMAYNRKIRLSDYQNLFRNKTNLFLFIQGIIGTLPWGAIPL